jgi:hypothetical protein
MEHRHGESLCRYAEPSNRFGAAEGYPSRINGKRRERGMSKFTDALGFLQYRKRAYQRTFAGSAEDRLVMADLAKFCRATASCFHPDPRIHARLEGRRDVYLRIANHLNMTPEELMKEFGGVQWQNPGQ